MAVDREFYVYRFGRPRTGRTDGRTGGGRTGGRRADGRTAGGRADSGRTGGRTEGGRQTDGRTETDKPAAGTILNDSTTIFIHFHKQT